LLGGFCVIIIYEKFLKKTSKYSVIFYLIKIERALAFALKLCYFGIPRNNVLGWVSGFSKLPG